ncbi:hypothetical protein CJ195_14395 [Bacillus sp. UMB0899]|nr:hypothetical protein CJ195_14395 [Bacillus sp. UMB0899]
MQINQDLKVSSQIPSTKSVQLREGDIYSALVKERLPQNEAILQIRGQDIKVKFEGEPPKQNQVTVEVRNNEQNIPRVKTIPLPTSTAPQANAQSNAKVLARQLNGGTPVSSGTQTAVDSLLSKGIPLNKVTFQHIQSFIDNHPSTLDQKLETISALMKKGLEPTATHLKAVFRALHDKSFASSIEELIKEIDPGFRFKVQESPTNSIKSADQLTEHAQRQLKAAVQRVIEAINQLEKKMIDPKKLEVLQQIKNGIHKNDVTTAVQSLRKSFSSEIIQAPEVSSKLSDAIKLDNMVKAESQNQLAKNQSNTQAMVSAPKQIAQQALSRLNHAIDQLEKLIVDPKKLQMLQQIKNDIGEKNITITAQNLTKLFATEVMKTPVVSSNLTEAVNLDRLAKLETQVSTVNQSAKLEQAQQLTSQPNRQGIVANNQNQSAQQALSRLNQAIDQLEKLIVDPKKLQMLQQVKNSIGKQDVTTIAQNVTKLFASEIMKTPEVSKNITEAVNLERMAKTEAQVSTLNHSTKPEQAQQITNQIREQKGSTIDQRSIVHQIESRIRAAINLLEKSIASPKKLEMIQQIEANLNAKNINTVVQNLRESFKNEIKQTPEVSSKLLEAVKLNNLMKNESQSIVQNQSANSESIQQLNKASQQLPIDQAIKQLKSKITDPAIPQAREIQKAVSQAESINNLARQEVNKVLHKLAKEDLSPKNIKIMKEIQEGLLQGKSIEQTVGKPSTLIENKLLSQQLENAMRMEKSAVALLQRELGKVDNIQTNVGNAIQKAMQVLRKEPNMKEVFNKLSALLDQNTILENKQRETLATSVQKAEEYLQSGKELGARQELMNTLTKMNQEIPASQNQHTVVEQAEQTEAYKMQEDLIASLPIQSKDFIVETVSKKLSQVAIDFKNFKNDISKSLNTVEQLVQQFKSKSTVAAKPMLETIIKKLDQAILRSDFMLYADMRTEKKLLTASTQLTEAKKLLLRGDHSGANKLVSEVRTVLDKMLYKPSDVRVKHFVSQEVGKIENIPITKEVTQNFEQSMSALKQEPSARNSFEFLRNLGLTHEVDHAQALVAKERNQEGLSPSLKSLLLKMTQNDGELLQSQKADQILSNLTGQQLLSKNDAAGLQNLMFTLPLLLQDKLENVKVFVNSKNQNEKIDWENCSLFFLFETKKLGEVGIALTSNDRTLSIKIKNDQKGFREKMEPLAVLAKERLSDIGYNISGIKFEPLNKLDKTETMLSSSNVQQTQLSKMTEKGYDFSV